MLQIEHICIVRKTENPQAIMQLTGYHLEESDIFASL
ncbi:hypothetical protein PPE_05220 [Paenibacillus polymyxa E681]|nr:hypothetical protein PPE_05220 [Paenibacillus polymyxa E681]